MVITTKEQLDALIEEKESLYLYGAGNWGLAIADYLIDNGNKNKLAGIFVTELAWNRIEHRGLVIQRYEADKLERESTVLVCMFDSSDTCRALKTDGMECITFETLSFLPNNPDAPARSPKEFKGLDFVVAGFHKCGTSSLSVAMKKNYSLCMPRCRKETLFYNFKEFVDNPMQVLANMFPECRQEQRMVGSVDPSFFRHARDLYEDFGEKLKIILILRNPVKAVFSHFCMSLRNGAHVEKYKAYQEYSTEMFDIYYEKIPSSTVPYYYDKWVEEFIEVFGKRNVHIVFFEELVKEPHLILEGIYEFLGVDFNYHFSGSLPRENEGKWVPATREGLLLAEKKTEIWQKGVRFPDKGILESEEYKQIEEQCEQIPKVLNPTMEDYQVERLKIMFSDSVRNLEKIIGRDLSQLWF